MTEVVETTADVRLDLIDHSIARSVRAGLDQDHADRMEASYAAGKPVPPVDLFTWPGADVLLLADGEHRCVGRSQTPATTIPATVHEYPSEDAARRAAHLFAVAANEHPAKPRTAEDKAAAVRTCLLESLLPPDASDRDVADLCRVSRFVVRKVRIALTLSEDLTGKAASTGRYQDEDASGRGAAWDEIHGGRATSPADDAADEPEDLDPDPTDLDEPAGDDPEPDYPEPEYGDPVGESMTDTAVDVPPLPPDDEPFPDPPAAGAIKPGKRLKDAFGRVLPKTLIPTFNADLPPDVEGIDHPFCLCPHVLDGGPTAAHVQEGRCHVCTTGKVQSRGWLTEGQYDGLSEQLRKLCRTGPDPLPPHPFAELMKDVTGLSRKVTLAANDPKNARLLRYLTDCGLMERWDKVIDGRRSVGAFKLLRGLRKVIDLAGRSGPDLRTAKVKAEYDDATKNDQAA